MVMFSVRGGLYGKYVVKVETTSRGLIFSASAVVSFGCATAVVTVAVRVGEVSAGTTVATTDFSSSVAPAADGTTTGLVPLSVILASRGFASSPAAAADFRTAATSFALSIAGASL